MNTILSIYLLATKLIVSPALSQKDPFFTANFNVIANAAKVRLILHNPARQVIKIQMTSSDNSVIYEELILRKTLQFYTIYNVDDLAVGKYFFTVSSGSQTLRYVFYVDPPYVRPYEPTKVVSIEPQ